MTQHAPLLPRIIPQLGRMAFAALVAMGACSSSPLSTMSDMTTAPTPDQSVPADLTTPPDLTPLADLTPAPDLAPAPTCTDGVKDGLETGVDCGGAMCTALGDFCGACSMDLSNIGTQPFAINFTVTTTATIQSDLANQRADCNGLTPGDGLWDIYMLANGSVTATIADGTNRDDLITTATINDGKPHTVTLLRNGGSFFLLVDKTLPGVSLADTGVNIASLVPIMIGTDACDPFGTYHPLVGTVTNVCINH